MELMKEAEAMNIQIRTSKQFIMAENLKNRTGNAAGGGNYVGYEDEEDNF